MDKPKLVFFFDEAHLLFNDAPKVLIERIELVVRLVRSKGVGVYFVTQNPLGIPDSILWQFGNCVQHVLRAFTPRGHTASLGGAQHGLLINFFEASRQRKAMILFNSNLNLSL